MYETHSVLPVGLIEAYKMTEFRVLAESSFILKVANYSTELESLFEKYAVESGCFITAYNPYSRTVPLEENLKAQQNLKQTLLGREFRILEGLGTDPSGDWEGEPSFFVLGISIKQSKTLGVDFKQNAIVWCDEKFTPELVLLR